jgi:hypothetical protein
MRAVRQPSRTARVDSVRANLDALNFHIVQSYADALKHLMAEDAEIKALVEANDLPMTL